MPLTRVTGNVVQDASLPESKLINPYVNVSGDTMTGTLRLPSNGLFVGSNQLVAIGGNIGVKTTNPSYTLDVNGTLRVTGQLITNSSFLVDNVSLTNDGTAGSPSVYFFNENNTGFYRSSPGTITFSSVGTLAASINANSFKNFSGVFSVARSGSLFSTDNVIEYQSGTDTYYFGKDASTLNFRTSSANNRIVINSIGQVSIGTATSIAGTLLNVAGRVNASGGYSGVLLTDLPTVTTAYGGTGITSYSSGDILYYSSGNTFTKISAPGVKSLFYNDGSIPSWTNIPLAVSFGGTGLTNSPSNGQILIGNGTTFTLNTISPDVGVYVLNTSGNIGIGVTNIPNSSITNNFVTINTGIGITGGGVVPLGGTLNLVSTGVTSVSAGTGITLSGSTGSVLISNSGVTSAVAGSGITISSSTGSVTYSLDPSYSPSFQGLTLANPLNINSGGTGISSLPSVNQVLYGNNSNGYSQLSVIGLGVTITPDFVNNTLTFAADFTSATVSTISKGNSNVSIPQSNGSIVFTTANSEILRITPSQQIGIGTTTPSSKIDFGGSQLTNGKIISLYSNNSLNQFIGLGLSPTSAGIRVCGTPLSVGVNAEIANIGYYSTDGLYTFTSVLYAANNNRIGINNSSPSSALDVTGSINLTDTITIGSTKQLNSIIDTVTTNTSQVTIDTFSASTYRSAKYIIQILNTDNTIYQVSEILLIHNGISAYITEYGIINTGGSLGVLDATVSSGNVNLLLKPTYSNNKIRVSRKLIGIQ